MLHNTTTAKNYSGRKAAAVKAIEANAEEAVQTYIRRQFDNAFVDTTAEGAIEVAEMLGYYELAEEMRADFYTETGREASRKEVA